MLFHTDLHSNLKMSDDGWQSDTALPIADYQPQRTYQRSNRSNGNYNDKRSGQGRYQNNDYQRNDRSDRRPQNNRSQQNGGFRNQDSGSPSEIMYIDPSKVGMVIGRGGSKIREIQDDFNVHVHVGKF